MSGVPITVGALPGVTPSGADSIPVWDAESGIQGRVTITTFGTIFALLTGATFTGPAAANLSSNGSASFNVNSADYGAAAWGPFMQIGRNSNADGGGGMIRFVRRGGANAHVWVDDSLVVRVSTGLNGGSTGDVSGTVVGTQTSSLDQKDVIGQVASIEEVLAAIAEGAAAVRRFAYKGSVGWDDEGNEIQTPRPYGGELFEGVIVDYAGRYGTDRDDAHPNGKSLNTINVVGDLLRAVAWLLEQNADMAGRLAALEAGSGG